MRGIYVAGCVCFLSLVGVALAGSAPDQDAAPVASCHGQQQQAQPRRSGGGSHGGQAVAASSCHGSKATRRTFAQRRADRQADRQEDRAERRASSGCHGGTPVVAAACACPCDSCAAGDCEGCR